MAPYHSCKFQMMIFLYFLNKNFFQKIFQFFFRKLEINFQIKKKNKELIWDVFHGRRRCRRRRRCLLFVEIESNQIKVNFIKIYDVCVFVYEKKRQTSQFFISAIIDFSFFHFQSSLWIKTIINLMHHWISSFFCWFKISNPFVHRSVVVFFLDPET